MKAEDQFENSLTRQRLRTPPTEWREEIFESAFQAKRGNRGNEAAGARNAQSGLSLVTSAATRVFSQLLWPSRKAWAGLVAIWVVIIGFIIASGDSDEKRVVSRFERSSPLVRELLREQNQLFVELSGGMDQAEPIETRRDQRGPRSGREVAWREV
jgi:hypothetical protein